MAHVVTVMHELPDELPGAAAAAATDDAVAAAAAELDPQLLQLHRLHVAVRDDNAARLFPYFRASNAAIEGWLAQGRSVLVHCGSGISRSATVALAYVVGVAGVPLHGAYVAMRARRPCICPGTTFFADLQELEVAVATAAAAAAVEGLPEGEGGQQAPTPPPLLPSMSLGEYYAHTVQHNAALMGGGEASLEACVAAVECFGFATDYALLQAIEQVVTRLQ